MTVWPKPRRRTLRAALKALLLAGAVLVCSAASGRDYKRWLNQEVHWIVSKAERQAFRQLSNDADREAFIDRFWADRDPTPGTPRNEYQEEHYQRLEYASEQFAETGPGWRSDRGRVYIIHGPPLSRSIEAEREIWTYNSNPNAQYYKGPITLVFERSASSFRERLISESRLAQQKAEERPGAPPNPLQQLNVTPRFRLVAAGPGYRPQLTLTAGETDRYIADILLSPGEVLEAQKREDAQRQQRLQKLRHEVESRVSFEPLPFDLETYLFPQPGDPVVVLRLTLDEAELAREAAAAGGTGEFDIYCEVRDAATGYRVDALDATVSRTAGDVPPDTPGLTFCDQFHLPAAEHHLSCFVRGVASGRTGTRNADLSQPSRSLALGKPILTQQIEQVPRQTGFDPLVLQDARFAPQARSFDPSRPVYLLLHVFHPPAAQPPGRLSFDYQIHTRQEVLYRSPGRPLPASPSDGSLPYALALDLSSFDSGQYYLLVKVHDSDRRDYALEELPFRLERQD